MRESERVRERESESERERKRERESGLVSKGKATTTVVLFTSAMLYLTTIATNVVTIIHQKFASFQLMPCKSYPRSCSWQKYPQTQFVKVIIFQYIFLKTNQVSVAIHHCACKSNNCASEKTQVSCHIYRHSLCTKQTVLCYSQLCM